MSEPRLLAAALERLRVAGDPAGARVLLAERRHRFPNGVLAPEAEMADLEALLALGRRHDALRALDRMTLGQMPRSETLSVLRGELRAEAGRCAEAVADFEGCAAAGHCTAELEARALYGRGLCRQRLGQREAARGDLELFLERFPRSAKAPAVQRALTGDPPL